MSLRVLTGSPCRFFVLNSQRFYHRRRILYSCSSALSCVMIPHHFWLVFRAVRMRRSRVAALFDLFLADNCEPLGGRPVHPFPRSFWSMPDVNAVERIAVRFSRVPLRAYRMQQPSLEEKEKRQRSHGQRKQG